MSLPAAFVSVILIWSTTPLAIKWSALGAGFSFAVFSRMAIGVLLCAVLLAAFRVRFPLHRKALLAYVAGGVSMFAAMALTYWSAQFVSSGMISVLFGLSPIITSLGAMLWLKEEALTPSKLAGMLLGVLGLAAGVSRRSQYWIGHRPGGPVRGGGRTIAGLGVAQAHR